MLTVVIALALILVGLSAMVFPIDFVNQALFLFAGDVLLIIGSLLPGI